MEYKDKLRQCDKECAIAIVGLAMTVCVWFVCGICLSNFDIIILSTPLWVVTGLGGTFLFACIFAIIFAKFLMKDIHLEEEEED